MIEQADEAHGSSSSCAANDDHLDPSIAPRADIPTPIPPYNDTRLYVPKDKQGDDHDPNRDIQTFIHLVVADAEVWDQREETTKEIA